MKKIIIPLIFLIGCSGTCKKNPFVEKVYSIKVVNQSTQWINFFQSNIFPDTSLPANKPYYGAGRPNNSSYLDSRLDWPDVFSTLPVDTLSIFILSNDTINKYDWYTVRNGYMILKRYDLSLGDLKQLNWTISFPASEAMKDMKQFPPY